VPTTGNTIFVPEIIELFLPEASPRHYNPPGDRQILDVRFIIIFCVPSVVRFSADHYKRNAAKHDSGALCFQQTGRR
jgi:hypothetical protein